MDGPLRALDDLISFCGSRIVEEQIHELAIEHRPKVEITTEIKETELEIARRLRAILLKEKESKGAESPPDG